MNPVTGEYHEDACDLIVAGCQELTARRYYNHSVHPTTLYYLWNINPESLIKANFEKSGIPLNVAIGKPQGGTILLDDRRTDSYSFNPKSQTAYTNFNGDLPSAQTNSSNIQLHYHKIKDPKTERFFSLSA